MMNDKDKAVAMYIGEILFISRKSHYEKTGHTEIFIGNNFVECRQCGKHAHVLVWNRTLIEHNSDYSKCNMIKPDEF